MGRSGERLATYIALWVGGYRNCRSTPVSDVTRDTLFGCPTLNDSICCAGRLWSSGYCCRFGVAPTSQVWGVRYKWCAVVVAFLWTLPARNLGASCLIPPQLGFRHQRVATSTPSNRHRIRLLTSSQVKPDQAGDDGLAIFHATWVIGLRAYRNCKACKGLFTPVETCAAQHSL
jgi:hypothetical protein